MKQIRQNTEAPTKTPFFLGCNLFQLLNLSAKTLGGVIFFYVLIFASLGTQAQCTQPSILWVNDLTATTAVLKWDVFNVAMRYKVRYKVSGTSEWTNMQSINNDKTLSGLSANTEYAWQVMTICTADPIISSDWSEKQFFTTDALRTISETSPAQENYFGEVFPNPASQSATVSFFLSKESFITIEILDLNRKSVRVITNENLPCGNHEVSFSCESLNAGIYFLQLKNNEAVTLKKLVIQ